MHVLLQKSTPTPYKQNCTKVHPPAFQCAKTHPTQKHTHCPTYVHHCTCYTITLTRVQFVYVYTTRALSIYTQHCMQNESEASLLALRHAEHTRESPTPKEKHRKESHKIRHLKENCKKSEKTYCAFKSNNAITVSPKRGRHTTPRP